MHVDLLLWILNHLFSLNGEVTTDELKGWKAEILSQLSLATATNFERHSDSDLFLERVAKVPPRSPSRPRRCLGSSRTPSLTSLRSFRRRVVCTKRTQSGRMTLSPTSLPSLSSFIIPYNLQTTKVQRQRATVYTVNRRPNPADCREDSKEE